MAQLLDIFGFISVLLRGLSLSLEALTIGGVVFSLVVERPPRASRLLPWFAGSVAFVQAGSVMLNAAILAGSTDMSWRDVTGAGFCTAGALMVSGALVVALLARSRISAVACPMACALILAGSVMNSHSFARLDSRGPAIALTFMHHLAGGAWIGGLLYLLVSLRQSPGPEGEKVAGRFSRVAIVSLVVLVSAGLGLSWLYVGSASALAGTTYGIMLASKVVLTGILLVLGGLNFRIVQAARAGPASLLPLRRFGEAELGIGFTVLLAAAALTSAPPAKDVMADVVTPAEIAERMRPKWPNMRTPAFAELAPAIANLETPAAQRLSSFVPGQVTNARRPEFIAWSEYNHHWAGLVVLAVGVLALLARRFSWARGWPLAFLGLAVFLFIRDDAEVWPLGPQGFWESFRAAEVAQHRFFVLLIVAFAGFEWAVQTGRIAPRRAGLVFPMVCAAGGALLLTHSHSLTNVKEEFLAELSHLPIAILGVTAGWSRWLEIRLSETRRIVSWVWPACFLFIGAILMLYRER